MALVSMKLDPKEAKAEYGATPTPSELPAYPYGLSLCLDDDLMKKLGFAGLPAVGTKFTLNAVVEVTSSRLSEDQGGRDLSADMQITDMELTAATAKPDPSAVLFDNKPE